MVFWVISKRVEVALKEKELFHEVVREVFLLIEKIFDELKLLGLMRSIKKRNFLENQNYFWVRLAFKFSFLNILFVLRMTLLSIKNQL